MIFRQIGRELSNWGEVLYAEAKSSLEVKTVEARIVQVARGWAAVGQGWAVIAPTRNEAQEKFQAAEENHRLIMERPDGEGKETD